MMYLLAHSGHGTTDGGSLLHYLIEPAHLPFAIIGAIALMALGGWVVSTLARRSDQR